MTPTNRPCLTLASALLVCSAAHAQAPAAASNAFGALPATNAEREAVRTSALLAQSQKQRFAPVYTSNPQMTRLDDRWVVVGQHQTVPVEATAPRAVSLPMPEPLYAAPASAPAALPPPPVLASPAPAPRYAAAPAPMSAAPVVAGGEIIAGNDGANVIPPMPAARAGECFALVKRPERFKVYQKQFIASAASERIETVPPRYESVTEQYVAQEAYEKMEVIPATFRTVTDQVQLTAPTTGYVASEPIYETVTERVLEQPARTVWKRGTGPVQRIDVATGDVMCLVDEPAVYKTVSRRVLKTPASSQQVKVPAQYTPVSRQVLERPAEVRRVVVPEVIATRTVRKLVEPGTVRRIAVPQQLGSTTVRELVQPAALEWRSVVCETNMTPQNVQRVQAALVKQGYNPGPVNGQLNTSTLDALNAYQQARNLPQDRFINTETAQALGMM